MAAVNKPLHADGHSPDDTKLESGEPYPGLTSVTTADHIQRVRKELLAAGVTKYGLLKMESRYLPSIIHEDENIGGVAYGRYASGSGMLIATDRRVIFLDRKPLFTISDELSYDAIAGILTSTQGLWTHVILHTRVTDYSLRYVNTRCAKKFEHFIEVKRIENQQGYASEYTTPYQAVNSATRVQPLTKKERSFLGKHETAVLSTVDRTGNVQGAAIYYKHYGNELYVLTKASTRKARNIFAHNQVALTVYDNETLETLQLQGMAEIETRAEIKSYITNIMTKPRQGMDLTLRLPPVLRTRGNSFIVLKIVPMTVNYSNYGR